jgi:hypothetical protein
MHRQDLVADSSDDSVSAVGDRYASNRLRVFIDWAAELFGRLA